MDDTIQNTIQNHEKYSGFLTNGTCSGIIQNSNTSLVSGGLISNGTFSGIIQNSNASFNTCGILHNSNASITTGALIPYDETSSNSSQKLGSIVLGGGGTCMDSTYSNCVHLGSTDTKDVIIAGLSWFQLIFEVQKLTLQVQKLTQIAKQNGFENEICHHETCFQVSEPKKNSFVNLALCCVFPKTLITLCLNYIE
jgi:hypothetical protein